MSDDMATMPVRDLIEGMRDKAKDAFNKGGMVDGLVLNVLARRLEQEANWSDLLQRFLQANVPTWREEIEDDQYGHNQVQHIVLHRNLDELFACFVTEHPEKSGFLKTPLEEFLKWSHKMTLDATCEKKEDKG